MRTATATTATVCATMAAKTDGSTCFLLLDFGSVPSDGVMNACMAVNRPTGVGGDLYFMRSIKVSNTKSTTLQPIVEMLLAEITAAGGQCAAVLPAPTTRATL